MNNSNFKLFTSGRFKCPQHICATCGDATDATAMVACNRCPVSYHLAECCPMDSCVLPRVV